MKAFLEAGEFTTTHGIAGELRLYPWCDEPAFLTGFSNLYLDEAGARRLDAERIRPHKNICIVKLQGVDSIEDARVYIGKTVYINRDEVDLPEGRHFVQDLLGAQVVDADTGEVYGTVAAITRPGRHDVYEIKTPKGTVALFPAAEPFMDKIDTENGVITVRPIPGMFDGEAGQ